MTSVIKHPSGHLAILASAGSGKTTRLTHRYIQLLADKDLEATPDRICALTFTRKAAGEIFDRIVACLCHGAAGRAQASELAEQIAGPGLDERGFARLLRMFLDNLHRAVIGTMDSFVAGVVRAFPIELGIPSEFHVYEANDAEGQAIRRDILADILAAPGAGADALLEAFKKATFGVEEKSFARFLNGVVAALHLSYRFCPDKTKWGNPHLIWTGKDRMDLKIHVQAELLAQAERVKQWLEDGPQANKGINRQFLETLHAMADALAAHGLAIPWNSALKGVVFDQLLSNRGALRNKGAMLSYRGKNINIPPPAAAALAVLTDNLAAVEIVRALEKTSGLRGLLELYDRAYETVSRESGRFSFTDVQYLLASGNSSRNVAPISRKQEEGRLFIDYRMDGRLDHWLIDEFQDTSDLQWAIFSNLVSELVQGDPEGRVRSFFYVGDIKQSIYRWRGGNPGLFLDIRKQYNQAGEVIRLETMSATRRCSQPVVDVINKVFSDLPTACLPAGAIAAWETAWSNHATLNKQAQGHVALLQHAPTAENKEEQEAEARYRLTADLLNEIRPVERGIEVGILTRTNEACSELVNVLRRECPKMAFVHEGKAGIVENELAQGLLALVRLAAHPGDQFAWQYVRMSPLPLALEQQAITRNNIAPRLLNEIEAMGFQSFITLWGRRLEPVCALNAFGRQCLALLEKAAAEFDAAGMRDCNRFLQFIADYDIHGKASRGAVRIMTIHQAKGLGFDMVILPQLQHRTKMNMARAEWADKDMLYGGKQFDPDWILKSPKLEIAENDPVLGARLREIDANHCFDLLCLLYVAMTRAKNALYMIASPASKTSATFRPAALLKLQLTGSTEPEAELNARINDKTCAQLYSPDSGNEKWFESFPIISLAEKAAGPAAPCPADFSKRPSRRKVLKRSEPSRQETFERDAADFFKPLTRDILDFGAAIHELFEKIEWLDTPAGAEAIIKSWLPSRPCDPKVHDDVLVQFRKCLEAPEVRQVLSRPADKVELWREKSFEIILDGVWVSGVFDRVTIARNPAGEPVEAAILDFKSNRGLATEASMLAMAGHYRPQMELYRRALSGILGLADDRISTQLLFTVPARIIILTSDH